MGADFVSVKVFFFVEFYEARQCTTSSQYNGQPTTYTTIDAPTVHEFDSRSSAAPLPRDWCTAPSVGDASPSNERGRNF